MKKRTIFITGTDTNVGKTYISVGLLTFFEKKGFNTIGLKPIASGCSEDGKNDDALKLQQAATVFLPYEQVNPFALQQPIAPHLAAKNMGLSLSVNQLNEKMAAALSIATDICLIEGAGGWLIPLNEQETYADYVLSHNMEIILVVGMRLGCINHALLTCQSILQHKGKLIGWVANSRHQIMDHFDENLTTLTHLLPVPHLGTVMPEEDPSITFSQASHLLMKKNEYFHQANVAINGLVD